MRKPSSVRRSDGNEESWRPSSWAWSHRALTPAESVIVRNTRWTPRLPSAHCPGTSFPSASQRGTTLKIYVFKKKTSFCSTQQEWWLIKAHLAKNALFKNLPKERTFLQFQASFGGQHVESEDVRARRHLLKLQTL